MAFYGNLDTAPIDLSGINSTFYSEIQYGNCNIENMDIYIPDDAIAPTGIVIDIYGGGFESGNKDSLYNATLETRIRDYLGDDIAYCLINYKLLSSDSEDTGVIESLESGKRAIQFLKLNSTFLNLNVNRFILKGSSSGAGIAMYLAYGPDQAIPGDPNPLNQQSTLAHAAVLSTNQATYDLKKWETVVYADLSYDLDAHYANDQTSRDDLHRFYGIKTLAEFYIEPTVSERASVDLLDFIATTGGVETHISNSNSLAGSLLGNGGVNNINHDPRHAKVTKDALEAEGTIVDADISAYGFTRTETLVQFIKRKIAE